MIKNLRKRFILAAMASTFGVLLVIMSILNVANYYRMVSRADETLTELGDNNGRFDSGDFVKKKPDISWINLSDLRWENSVAEY